MCQLCEEASFAGRGVAIVERPAQLLGGRWWCGSFEEAAAGAIREAMREVQSFSNARPGLWKSAILGLTRLGRPGGFDYFVGVSVEPDEALPAGFERLELPAMTVASSWHGPGDGDVVAHYGQMIGWLRDNLYRRDNSVFDQREEYPHDVDPEAAPRLRIMLPVIPADGGTADGV